MSKYLSNETTSILDSTNTDCSRYNVASGSTTHQRTQKVELFLLSWSHNIAVKNGLGLLGQTEDQRLLRADGAQEQVLDVWEEAAFHLVE